MTTPISNCSWLAVTVLLAACGGTVTTPNAGDGGSDDTGSVAETGSADTSTGDTSAGDTSAGDTSAGETPGVDATDAAIVCTSGKTALPSPPAPGGPLHDPGAACGSSFCHGGSGALGPLFTISGTVYPTLHEPDNCFGVAAGATQVVITDGSGKTTTLVANAAGNFFGTVTLSPPFLAKVVAGGKENAALTPQTSGDCNSCHTMSGKDGAPGRIVTP